LSLGGPRFVGARHAVPVIASEAKQSSQKIMTKTKTNLSLFFLVAVLVSGIAYSAEMNIDAYYARGIAHLNQGEFDKALTVWNEAIRLTPKIGMTYKGRCEAYMAKEEYDKAIADINKAIRLSPKDAMAYYDRGLVYKVKGDAVKAEADFARAKEIGVNGKGTESDDDSKEESLFKQAYDWIASSLRSSQ